VIDAALPAPPDVFGRVSVYLDRQGFPQVFAEIRGVTSPPVNPPTEGAVAVAADRGQLSTVQVEALGCGGISSGSGFVTEPGFVVTNAHVVAGGRALSVRDRSGLHEAVAIHVDPRLDLAVLSAPDITAVPISWVATPSTRGTAGAILGYPGGQRELAIRPAAVRARLEAVGRDIYGRGTVARDLLTLSSDLSRGDSGGPFVTSDGLVGGVVFAAADGEPGIGYALTAEEVSDDVAAAITRDTAVSTGACRY
jgi:S1-C subfamily serine protease